MAYLGPRQGGPLLLLPPQMVLLLPGVLHPLCLLHPYLMKELSLGLLTDVMQDASCDDDPEDVALGELEEAGEDAQASI